MTIKQQGGIFGRNPTFNDVTVDDTLTAATQVNTPRLVNGVASGTLTIGAGAAHNTGANILMYGESHPQVSDFLFRAGTTGLVRIQDSGEVKILNGNLRFDTAGTGIDFSATSGTGTSELFGDYEEGTWTPNLARFSGGSITATYSNQVGYYTKVGNLVTLTCYVTISSISAQGSSYAYINGLPFSPIRSNDAVGIVSANSGFATVEIRTCIANNNSRLYFRTVGNGAGLASPNFLAGGEISLTLQYMTS
jgi:hypothetical protein